MSKSKIVKTAQSEGAVANATRDLEDAVNKVRLMAGVAADVIEELFEGRRTDRKRLWGNEDLYWLSETTVERALFVVYEAQAKAEEMTRAYYGALDAGRTS
jgi:hypothetical protein